jgi:hypothetical protein
MELAFAFSFGLDFEYLNKSRCIVDDFLKAVLAERVVIHEIFTFFIINLEYRESILYWHFSLFIIFCRKSIISQFS